MRAARWLALTLLLALPASPYTRQTISGSLEDIPLFRSDVSNIRFLVSVEAVGGLRNADGRLFITAGSEPVGALQAALDSWSQVPDSAVRFAPIATGDFGFDPGDGRNVIVFRDTPAIRALTMNSVAVTRVQFSPSTGEISESDIIFNPNFRQGNNVIPFSTTSAPNAFDIQSVATHSLGLALGAGISGTIAAAMSPLKPLDTNASEFRRTLSYDDRAFLIATYPAPGAAANYGSLFGAVTVGGAPATGVLLTAVEPEFGFVASAISDLDDGTFRIDGLPMGRYFLYGEALDGPVIPADIQFVNVSKFNTDVLVRYQGGNQIPQRARVINGTATRVNLGMEVGVRPVGIEQIGVAPRGSAGMRTPLTTGPIQLTAGQSADILLVGPGVDASLLQEDIQILAPGVTIRPGSVFVDPTQTAGLGRAPIVRMTVDVAPRASRDYGSIIVRKGNVLGSFSGALVIEGVRPVFTAAGVVNAASFLGRGVAPGAIASIFGVDLGPSPGVPVSGFDPQTGLLGTSLGGVRVTFDGVPAPLFFVYAGQINLQAPIEIAGKTSVDIVIEYNGSPSAPITVPVVAADPGIFADESGLRAVVLNQDNTVNSVANPAARGEFITVFLTGQGLVSPPLTTGQQAGRDQLSRVSNVSVTIGGVPVPPGSIFFAGMTPDLVGLAQVNVQVIELVEPGDAVTIVIRIGGIASQPSVTIAVK